MSEQRDGQEPLQARLAGLREDPALADEFRAALHRRLSAAPPAPTGPWQAVREAVGLWLDRFRPLAWPMGGAVVGVGVFAALVLVHGWPGQQQAFPVASQTKPAPAIALASEPAAPVPLASRPAEAAAPALEEPTGEVSPRYRVPASKVAVIKLTFSASVAVSGATFDVALPEGLSFWSGGERLAERSVRWRGDLSAGDNLIPIAVRADRPGQYRVLARVDAEGEELAHEIILDVQGES